jgi:heavy metal efflux system protein
MIKSVVSFSLNNRLIVLGACLASLALGVWCFYQLKIEAYPDIADTNVTVITKYDGRAAEEVEQKITIPIERALNKVPNVIARRSRTIFGLSVVQLNFEDGVEDYFARQQVLAYLAEAEIPSDANPALAPLTSAIGEIYRYVVEAPPSYTRMDLRVLQDWVIIPKLLQTSGVADIATFGGPVKQFHILTSPSNLRKYDLRIQDILDAVNKNNHNTGGGIIARGAQGFAVRGMGNIRGKEDIENIVISTSNGVPIFIKNVGTVEINPPTPSGVLGYIKTHENEDVDLSTEGIVLMRRHENPSDVLAALKAKVKELQDTELPKDVKLTVIYDRGFLVDHSMETVAHTLVEGITIAIVVIFLFLGSFRSALVVAVTIPFSLLFAFTLMQFTHIPANLLSLGAIDFGIIVDGAGRMAENIIRRLEVASPEEKKKGFLHICVDGAQEVGKEIFYCVLIIILAYTPIFTMQRVEGKLFMPMALTLAYALLGSMICALTLTPVLISFAYSKILEKENHHHKESKWKINFRPFYYLQEGYGYLLIGLMRISKPFLIVFALTVGVGFYYAGKIGTEFLPQLDEGSIWMRCILPAGTNIGETARIAPHIRKEISRFFPVDYVMTQSGRNDDGTDPIPSNRMEIMIVLKEYHLWSDTLPKSVLINRIKNRLEQALPGVSVSFGQPIIDQVMEIVTGSAAHLAVSMVGDDLIMMRQKADSILTMVRGTQGSTGSNIEQEGPQAQIAIEIDRNKMARYGINISEVQDVIAVAVGGKPIDVVYDGARKYDIVVRYYAENRNTLEDIEEMQVFSANGSLIPMRDLAQIKYVDGQTNIFRLDGKRMITVRTNISDRDQGSFVKELKEKIEKGLKIPEGYYMIYGGQFENLARASKQLLLAVPMTLVIVFIILFVFFRSTKFSFIVLSCVPIGLVGGALALMVRGYNFNISSGVGFISLFGISVMAGIMSVSFLNNAVVGLKNEMLIGFNQLPTRANYTKLILTVTKEQLRPQMMVMIVALLALVPAALTTGIGSDVQRPLATVIIGGLVTNLILTPFIIPCMYWAFGINKVDIRTETV